MYERQVTILYIILPIPCQYEITNSFLAVVSSLVYSGSSVLNYVLWVNSLCIRSRFCMWLWDIPMLIFINFMDICVITDSYVVAILWDITTLNCVTFPGGLTSIVIFALILWMISFVVFASALLIARSSTCSRISKSKPDTMETKNQRPKYIELHCIA